jgi:hypothetical protein
MQTITTQRPSAFDARFMLLYDDANLYVGMKLQQSGTAVTATQTANDVGFGLDDFAGVGIDPTANGGQVYFFMTTPLGTRWNVGAEIDGTRERPTFGGAPSGQWLRRISVGETIDKYTNFTLGLRDISGTGGFAQRGVNLAGSFHHRFKNDSELFVNYGTPAAPATLQRVVVKYVLRTGGGAGT